MTIFYFFLFILFSRVLLNNRVHNLWAYQMLINFKVNLLLSSKSWWHWPNRLLICNNSWYSSSIFWNSLALFNKRKPWQKSIGECFLSSTISIFSISKSSLLLIRTILICFILCWWGCIFLFDSLLDLFKFSLFNL